MSKSKIEKRLPEPQHSKEQKADGTSVRPAIAKPNVICSQNNQLSTTLSEAKELFINAKNLSFDEWFLVFRMHLRDIKGFYEWVVKTYSIKQNDFVIVKKNGKGFVIDVRQIRDLYSSMLSNPKLVSPPS